MFDHDEARAASVREQYRVTPPLASRSLLSFLALATAIWKGDRQAVAIYHPRIRSSVSCLSGPIYVFARSFWLRRPQIHRRSASLASSGFSSCGRARTARPNKGATHRTAELVTGRRDVDG